MPPPGCSTATDQLAWPSGQGRKVITCHEGHWRAWRCIRPLCLQTPMAGPRPGIRADALLGGTRSRLRRGAILGGRRRLEVATTRSRRAAWFLPRSTGGWNAAESDLRLATDADPELAGLGRTQVSNWLTTRAGTIWQPLPVHQRAKIAALLDAWDASLELRRTLGFHAGHAGTWPRPGS